VRRAWIHSQRLRSGQRARRWRGDRRTGAGPGASDRKAIYKEIERRHDESVKRLQEWIGVGSIAAENIGMAEGCDAMRRLALDAGFQRAECIQTKGHPGVFATLDAGARRDWKPPGIFSRSDTTHCWSMPMRICWPCSDTSTSTRCAPVWFRRRMNIRGQVIMLIWVEVASRGSQRSSHFACWAPIASARRPPTKP
jgi:hypothetical protein